MPVASNTARSVGPALSGSRGGGDRLERGHRLAQAGVLLAPASDPGRSSRRRRTGRRRPPCRPRSGSRTPAGSPTRPARRCPWRAARPSAVICGGSDSWTSWRTAALSASSCWSNRAGPGVRLDEAAAQDVDGDGQHGGDGAGEEQPAHQRRRVQEAGRGRRRSPPGGRPGGSRRRRPTPSACRRGRRRRPARRAGSRVRSPCRRRPA